MTPTLTPFYKINRSDYFGGERAPEEVMATRFTASTVWLYHGLNSKDEVMESRACRRVTDYDAYYPTLDEAIAASREVLSKRITRLVKTLVDVESRLASARAADEKFRKQQECGKGRMIAWTDPGKLTKNIQV